MEQLDKECVQPTNSYVEKKCALYTNKEQTAKIHKQRFFQLQHFLYLEWYCYLHTLEIILSERNAFLINNDITVACPLHVLEHLHILYMW